MSIQMNGISDYAAETILNAVLRNSGTPVVTQLYLAFSTGVIAKTDITVPNEVSGAGYARVAANFAVNLEGMSLQTGTIQIPATLAITANWGIIVSMCLVDSATSSGGEHIWFFTEVAAKNVNKGDPALTFIAGTLKVYMGP